MLVGRVVGTGWRWLGGTVAVRMDDGGPPVVDGWWQLRRWPLVGVEWGLGGARGAGTMLVGVERARRYGIRLGGGWGWASGERPGDIELRRLGWWHGR